MALHLYNTLTNSLEAVVPIDPTGRRVTFYTCGPTVYDVAHIGNFRSFLSADILRRTLEGLGHEVVQVMNITDVGHMTKDDLADGGGEDKMAIAARRLRVMQEDGTLPGGKAIDPNDPGAVASWYADAFLDDARRLGIKVVLEAGDHPERLPRPTGCIEAMIELVETLLAKEHAYVAEDGVVYFDVASFPDYGVLSGNTPEAIRSGEGGRVDLAVQAVKRHPADFMLWKPDPGHLMRWPSPWGEGYPGWHLECTVMAQALLGPEIDLHSGGEDNIFPHHECEIAQARSASGAESFARHWFHTRHLLVDGGKMSKSRGTCWTLGDLMARGASPAAVRLELIRTHYRSNANFTLQGLRDSQRQIDRWRRCRDWLVVHAEVPGSAPGPLREALEPCCEAMCADLNVAGAIGTLSEAVARHDPSRDPVPGDGPPLSDELEALHAIDAMLGVLDLEAVAPGRDDEADHIVAQITRRDEARRAGDWKTADEVREALEGMGVEIKDDLSGTTWRRVVR